MATQTEILQLEVAALKKKVKLLETFIIRQSAVPTDNDGQFSNKTTKTERIALRKHIEELEQKQKVKPARKPNTFKVDDIVNLIDWSCTRTHGKVQFITCKDALPSVRKCDKKNCQHEKKTIVWCKWPNGRVFAYHYSKLTLTPPEDLKSRIGRELSGRIGEWVFDAKTRLWKKDGLNRTFTEQEFDDYMFYEQYPEAKDEAARFLKGLMAK